VSFVQYPNFPTANGFDFGADSMYHHRENDPPEGVAFSREMEVRYSAIR
jgi:hypothetical protein